MFLSSEKTQRKKNISLCLEQINTIYISIALWNQQVFLDCISILKGTELSLHLSIASSMIAALLSFLQIEGQFSGILCITLKEMKIHKPLGQDITFLCMEG